MPDSKLFLPEHGGDRLAMAAFSGKAADDILDFSVNVRPDGVPDHVALALTKAMTRADAYPSPRGEEAVAAAAARWGLPPEAIVFGNGTSELFLALARALRAEGTPCAGIPEPAFNEYAASCRRAGLATRHPACRLVTLDRPAAPGSARKLLDWRLPEEEILGLPEGAALFLANPGNPAGTFLSPKALLRLMGLRPDLVWVLDEAFVSYAGRDSLVSFLPLLARHLAEPGSAGLPEGLRAVVVRSLTKFHALAGVRTGFAAATPEIARAIRAELPLWNSSCFALAAARAVIGPSAEGLADERETRARNRRRRGILLSLLSDLPCDVCRSAANYLLLRLDRPKPDLAREMLAREGIALRDCATFQGLEDGRWYRVAVRGEQDCLRLAEALARCLGAPGPGAPAFLRKRRVPALMLQGTSSGAGKSILAAAFCRILVQDGYSAAPFKAQNMSLNSGVTYDGFEMGRAQILQATAARLAPDVRMNPVLLKPLTDKGSQVVLMGRPWRTLDARNYLEARGALKGPILDAYRSLASEHEVMVLEGAGSSAEINLKNADLVNMNMALEAGAKVLLTGDIDRGGVYASFLGSWLTYRAEERKLLAGYLVNRFRGDVTLLEPAHDYMLRATGVPVLGVVPFVHSLDLPEEDSLSLTEAVQHRASLPDPLDIAMIVLGRTSNFTDVAPLGLEPDVNLRAIHAAEDWGNPDIIVIPGSRSVASDLRELREKGLAEKILAHARAGGWTVGICGGMQMLGERVEDPLRLESENPHTEGLGVLPLRTTLAAGKSLHFRRSILSPFGISCQGYEIHHGLTELTRPCPDLFSSDEPDAGEREVLGVLDGHCLGTYLHGLFDSNAFRRRFLDHVRVSLGKKPQGKILASWDMDSALDRLADIVRESVDLPAIYRAMGL